MPKPTQILTIGISSRALFDLEVENRVFEKEGLERYSAYQRDHEHVVLKPGAGFPIVQALLAVNADPNLPDVEVIVMSKNDPDTGLRIWNSIEAYKLPITRGAFNGGRPLCPLLGAFGIDLLLSKEEEDVQAAIDAGIAAAVLYDPPADFVPGTDEIHVAFDGDAVLFSGESEEIFRTRGMDAFFEHERANAGKPLPDGPFARFLRTLVKLQKSRDAPIRISLVTARNSPAHKRAILTFRAWGIKIDSAYFLGGWPKDKVLSAIGAHIFFDDQERHAKPASVFLPAGRVPYRPAPLALAGPVESLVAGERLPLPS